MKCQFCGAEMPIRAEHCPQCGKKAMVDFDVLAASVHEDAAKAKSEKISSYLKWGILAFLIIGAILYSINDLYNRPLVYDGSGLPAIQAQGSLGAVELPVIEKPYADPRTNPTLPQPRITAFGYRAIRDRLRQANKGDTMPAGVKTAPATAIKNGLKFLADSQISKSHWPVTYLPDGERKKYGVVWEFEQYQWAQVGVTALATLAFLGEGETWQNPKDGRPTAYGDKVQNAIRYLYRQQDAESGRFGPAEEPGVLFMYNHGMATLAMCEAAGMSGDTHLRKSAQKGIDYIVKGQANKGGWNYTNNPAGESDTSVSIWQVQALYAAREAGLNVPQETLNKALTMFQEATNIEAGKAFLRYRMEKEDKADRTNTTLVALGLMGRQLLGDDSRNPAIMTMGSTLRGTCPLTKADWGSPWYPNRPNNDDGQRAVYNPYFVYFATYGLYFQGGREWEEWHETMKRSVIEMQDNDGSWKCNDPYSYKGGNIYSTALSILTLQVYYRMQ